MTHGHEHHHQQHHDHGGHHHHHHPHHGQALPGFPVPYTYSYLPRTTVQYTYQLPPTTTTTVRTPLLEPRRPDNSGALVGLLTCIFCFVVAVVVFVLWI